jgi:hypothetical protein
MALPLPSVKYRGLEAWRRSGPVALPLCTGSVYGATAKRAASIGSLCQNNAAVANADPMRAAIDNNRSLLPLMSAISQPATIAILLPGVGPVLYFTESCTSSANPSRGSLRRNAPHSGVRGYPSAVSFPTPSKPYPQRSLQAPWRFECPRYIGPNRRARGSSPTNGWSR